MPTGSFPESLSQATLVGTIFVGRLGVHTGQAAARVRAEKMRSPRLGQRGKAMSSRDTIWAGRWTV